LSFYRRQNPLFQRSTEDTAETKIFLFLRVKDGTIALWDRQFYLTCLAFLQSMKLLEIIAFNSE